VVVAVASQQSQVKRPGNLEVDSTNDALFTGVAVAPAMARDASQVGWVLGALSGDKDSPRAALDIHNFPLVEHSKERIIRGTIESWEQLAL
jgi:hypothetical protein